MKIVGIDDQDATRFSETLDHGGDPELVAYRQGYVVTAPVDAVRDGAGDIVLRIRVRAIADDPVPVVRSRGQDKGLVIGADTVPEIRQRFAAYAVVRSSRGVLATEYSARTAVDGRWGMPGGGIDDHEQPVDAVLREVAEETSQQIVLGDLVRVQTSHWIGRSPRDTIEDFHAVRLIYRAECPHPTTPVVIDRGGTTESARWVPRRAVGIGALDPELEARPRRAAQPPLILLRRFGSTRGSAASRPNQGRKTRESLLDVAQEVLAGEHAGRAAVVEDQQRIAVDQHLDRPSDRLGGAKGRQRRLHGGADGVGRAHTMAEQRSEQAALAD